MVMGLVFGKQWAASLSLVLHLASSLGPIFSLLSAVVIRILMSQLGENAPTFGFCLGPIEGLLR